MPGLFVTFEGVEGSGKTTQLSWLAEALRRSGRQPVLTREPGGTPIAEELRRVFLAVAASPNPVTETLILEAARSDLVTKLLKPALQAGTIVLCDRYADSTLAYQGAGRGMPVEVLRTLNEFATGGLTPDVTFVLDVDPRQGLARKFQSPEEIHRLELETLDFHDRVRQCFLRLARASPRRFVTIDGALPPDQIHQRILSVVSARLSLKLLT